MASDAAPDSPDPKPRQPAAHEYDSLSERNQAVVRASWDEQLDERRAELDLEAEFVKAGRSWSEADAEGKLVERHPADASTTQHESIEKRNEAGRVPNNQHGR